MSRIRQFHETLGIYRKHGWRLERVLMTAEALTELRDVEGGEDARFEGVEPEDSAVDAIWLARAAQGGREAWELRLIGEPFALFELFEQDETEEDRDDVRREMEAKLREHALPREQPEPGA